MKLARGANRALSAHARRLQVAISWDEDSSDGLEADVDVSALLLDASRRVRTDADFVFFNQPSSPEPGSTAGHR